MAPDISGEVKIESNPFLRYMLMSLCENFFSFVSKHMSRASLNSASRSGIKLSLSHLAAAG